MSLFNIFDIAGSALKAQNVRLRLTAGNLANANAIAEDQDSAYRARHPIFSTVLKDVGSPGTFSAGVETVGIVESQRELPKRYEPGHPLADEEGFIYTSNVDTIEEMTNMISASRNYQTNVEIMNASKKLLLATLKIGQ